MYAAGRIPGSFFRREGRPGTDAILTCRLIDRPLRPSFVDGLRNEIQVVITVMSLNPQDLYDALAINAASASTQLSGLPFSGPIGGVRVALDRRPVGRLPAVRGPGAGRVRHGRRGPRRRRRRRDHDGRGRGHHRRPSSWSPAARRRRPRRSSPQGLEAAKPFIRSAVRGPAAAGRRRGEADRRVPDLPGLPARRLRGRRRGGVRRAGAGADHRRQAGARDPPRRGQGRRCWSKLGRAVRGPREGARRRVPLAEQEAGAPAHPARQGPHRRPRPHRHPAAVGRGRGRPAGARLGAVRARRDPDPGRHHAEHAAHGAADRLARPGDAQALHAPLQLPAVLDR